MFCGHWERTSVAFFIIEVGGGIIKCLQTF